MVSGERRDAQHFSIICVGHGLQVCVIYRCTVHIVEGGISFTKTNTGRLQKGWDVEEMPSLSLVPSLNNGRLQLSFDPIPAFSLERREVKFMGGGSFPWWLVTVRALAPSSQRGILDFALYSVTATAIFLVGLKVPWWWSRSHAVSGMLHPTLHANVSTQGANKLPSKPFSMFWLTTLLSFLIHQYPICACTFELCGDSFNYQHTFGSRNPCKWKFMSWRHPKNWHRQRTEWESKQDSQDDRVIVLISK